MPLFDRKTASLGIDIGSRSAKMILVHRHADRVGIGAAASCEIGPGMVERGVVRNPKVLGKLLARHVAASNLTGAHATVSIPSNLASLRWVSLPPLQGEELRQAARFKVKRHLAYPVESAYVSASEPELIGAEGLGQSLVIAVPRDVVESRAEALEHAGLVPGAAELEAQSVLRVVERRLNDQSALWRDASLTIIDVGAQNTHMYVVQSQRLQFIRGVKFGADLFANAVASALRLDKEYAARLVGAPGTEVSLDGVLTMASETGPQSVDVSAELDKLVKEFLRLLRYFRSLHPERSYAGILDHLVVCGGLGGLRGFGEYLEKALGLRVERARPFAGVVASLSTETFESISNRQESFTVAMGLALSGLERHDRIRGVDHAGREFAWARGA